MKIDFKLSSMPYLLQNYFAFLSFSNFSSLDLILGIVLAWGIIRGLRKGFIRELSSFLALILGVYGAIHFSYFLLDYLEEYLAWEENMLNIAALILTFIIIVILISLVGHIFTRIAKLLALNLLNRLLGAVFGFLKSAFLLGILLLFISAINTDEKYITEEQINASVLYTPMEKFSKKIIPSAVDLIKEHSPENMDWNFNSEEL